uniref:Uncharacterized protein n=1 Tax=viral metagenome TaxID=1070528 RepID=A0A6H1Z8Q2_9ZZZZ
MSMINKVYPFSHGFLIIGKYPHGTKFDADIIINRNRQPYLVYELVGKSLILRACQKTEKNALQYYHGGNHYLVYPTEY